MSPLTQYEIQEWFQHAPHSCISESSIITIFSSTLNVALFSSSKVLVEGGGKLIFQATYSPCCSCNSVSPSPSSASSQSSFHSSSRRSSTDLWNSIFFRNFVRPSAAIHLV